MIESMAERLVSPVFIGRRTQLAAAISAIERTVGGRSSHLLVVGEAGIGKTRFIDEVAALATKRGAITIRGSCRSAADGGLPYAPIAEGLRGFVRDAPADILAAVVGSSGPDLARIAPVFGRGGNLRGREAAESLQARLFDALLGFIERLSERSPVLLVAEDLHWADAATRQAVAFLAGTLRTESAAMVVSYRSEELPRRHPTVAWLAELERSDRLERIDLAPFDAVETHELMAAILESEPLPALVERIHRRSEGNAFFIEELLGGQHPERGEGGLPPTLRDVLLGRIASAPDAAISVASIVAVAGRPVGHDLLSAVAGTSEPDLLTAVRAAVGANLLVPQVVGEDEGYGFRHSLLQEAVYEDLLPGERRAIHRRLAEALTEDAADVIGRDAGGWAEIAHHWAAARDDQRAFEASIQAGDAADAAFAFETAGRQYDRALELWEQIPGAETVAGFDRVELLRRAARAAEASDDRRHAAALRRQAVDALDEGEEPVRGAVLLEELARALYRTGETDASLRSYEQAVAMLPADPPTAERARVLAGLGQIWMLLDRFEESVQVCTEAVRVARQVGAAAEEGHASNTMGIALACQGVCADGIAALERGLAIALRLRIPDDLGRAYANLTDGLRLCEQDRVALDRVEEGLEAAEAMGIGRSYGSLLRAHGARSAFNLGRWEEAAAQVERVFAAVGQGRNVELYVLAYTAEFTVASGEHETAEARLNRFADLLEGQPIEMQFLVPYVSARAELALWRHRPAEAWAVIDQALPLLRRSRAHPIASQMCRLGAWALADLAQLAAARRDEQAAAAAVERISRLRDEIGDILDGLAMVAPPRPRHHAEAATVDAEVSRALGASDPALWQKAAERWSGCERPYLASYARWREAEAHLDRGDRIPAREVLRNAHVIATGLPAPPLVGGIESLAKRARLDIAGSDFKAAKPQAPVDALDPFALTPREREVLGLIAEGRTNRQIAETLFITENTAGVHVSRILGKLGAASRTEAATIAHRAAISDVQD
jgi:DNA-binding CsgD family transcriptional regulator/tetratricopeptide (TPR) repeat protein